MGNGKTIYLVDGTAYVYRAYHAIRNLSNSTGLPTNAVLGFTKMLNKLIEDRSPEYIAMFFDSKGPTFRHKLYGEYKANRPPMPEDLSIQIPHIKKVSEGFNLEPIELQGFEADDLIGTIAGSAEKSGFNVVIITGDKDFMQLVTDRITIWDPMKDEILNRDSIKEKYNLDPEQMIDVMGLSGDTADNVPGVPGIGPKTAVSLIRDHGSMERLYENVDKITKKKQHQNLVEYRDQAFLSKELVTIDMNAPVPFKPEMHKFKGPDNEKLSKLFQDLEFNQLQQAFRGKNTDLSKKKYVAVMDPGALSDLVLQLESSGIFAIDTETTSKNPMLAKLVGLSFSTKADEAFYIPCCHDYPEVPRQLDISKVLQLVKPILENPDIKKIGQNIKYDWIVLSRHGIQLRGVAFDTMLASYLINPSKRAHGLDQIAMEYLGHQMITYKEVTEKTRKKYGKDSSFSLVPLEQAVPYACEDSDITFLVYEVLKTEMEKNSLLELFEKLEIPLIPVLMKMEMNGICVNRSKLRELSKSFEHQLTELESRIYSLAGEDFNINSSQQLGRILFEKLLLPSQKKTKKTKGYSTDVDVLTALSEHHELPSLILRYRTLAKLKSTYSDSLIDLIHPETGRIHTSFNQTVTATGRLSSSDPNLQNIPVKTDEGREIRGTFVPREGWKFIAADYSQIELRILAHYSNDEILIKAFLDDEDIHTRTASEVFQVFPSFITSELRRQAKVINFGIIYGMSPFGLSKELGISRKMAKTYIDNYFARYHGVKQFIDDTICVARKSGKISTLMGRVRLLPDINSRNKTVREFAERTAVNTPIQGTAADLIKAAMINVNTEFQKKKLRAAMLLSVHDEIIFEVPPDELGEVMELVREVMEGVWTLKVPLKVNVAEGFTWAEAH